jgi:hypothetical protein
LLPVYLIVKTVNGNHSGTVVIGEPVRISILKQLGIKPLTTSQ